MVRNRDGWAMRSRRVVGKGGQRQVATAGDGEEWSNLDGRARRGRRQTSSGRSHGHVDRAMAQRRCAPAVTGG